MVAHNPVATIDRRRLKTTQSSSDSLTLLRKLHRKHGFQRGEVKQACSERPLRSYNHINQSTSPKPHHNGQSPTFSLVPARRLVSHGDVPTKYFFCPPNTRPTPSKPRVTRSSFSLSHLFGTSFARRAHRLNRAFFCSHALAAYAAKDKLTLPPAYAHWSSRAHSLPYGGLSSCSPASCWFR